MPQGKEARWHMSKCDNDSLDYDRDVMDRESVQFIRLQSLV